MNTITVLNHDVHRIFEKKDALNWKNLFFFGSHVNFGNNLRHFSHRKLFFVPEKLPEQRIFPVMNVFTFRSHEVYRTMTKNAEKRKNSELLGTFVILGWNLRHFLITKQLLYIQKSHLDKGSSLVEGLPFLATKSNHNLANIAKK